jgi:hypothetical protein
MSEQGDIRYKNIQLQNIQKNKDFYRELNDCCSAEKTMIYKYLILNILIGYLRQLKQAELNVLSWLPLDGWSFPGCPVLVLAAS